MKTNPLVNLLFGFSFAAVLTAQAQVDIPAFTLGAVSANQPLSLNGTRGWIFSLSGGAETIAITRLGVFDSGGDGLVNSHEIGLWRSDGVLLTSATIPAGTGALLVDGYRYLSISPVFLNSGAITVIGAHYAAGDADDLMTPLPSIDPLSQTWRFASGIVAPTGPAGAGRIRFGSDLTFPSFQPGSPCEGCPAYTLFEPNFQFTPVPEPSALLLFIPSALYLLLRHRK